MGTPRNNPSATQRLSAILQMFQVGVNVECTIADQHHPIALLQIVTNSY